MKIVLKTKEVEIPVELIQNSTSKAILDKLPIKSTANTWGDEFYFDTGINAPISEETTDLAIGDIAYWPPGKCLCVFFGQPQ